VRSEVLHRINFLQESHHEEKFLVVPLVREGTNWDAVCELERERDDRVVHNHDVFQITILDDTQVFYVDAWCCLDAMLSVEAMSDDLTFLIDEVKNCISIPLFTGCKNTDLEHLRKVL